MREKEFRLLNANRSLVSQPLAGSGQLGAGSPGLNGYRFSLDSGMAGAADRALNQLAVGLQNLPQGLSKVAPSFTQSAPLRIYARNFLDIGDVPPPPLLNNSGEGAA